MHVCIGTLAHRLPCDKHPPPHRWPHASTSTTHASVPPGRHGSGICVAHEEEDDEEEESNDEVGDAARHAARGARRAARWAIALAIACLPILWLSTCPSQ
eukprot:COSAG01_NODE_952_length_12499_cov_84.157661_10_plen_100_part_00